MDPDRAEVIRGAILRTLSFFDVSDYPLTASEIHKWLYFPRKGEEVMSGSAPSFSMDDVRVALQTDESLKKAVDERDGFYCLSGRTDIVETRQRRYAHNERKFRKALRMTKLLRYVPYVRMVAVCNNLSYSNAKRDSDIDFFIVSHPKRAWLTRHYAALLAAFLRNRPSPDNYTDKACLSFYVTTDGLDLQRVAKRPYDIYLPYWIATVYPVYDEGGYYERFLQANEWIRRHLPNVPSVVPVRRRTVKRACRPVKRLLEAASPRFLNDIYREIQIRFMPKGLARRANVDTEVVVDDTMLKFHSTDRRCIIRDRYEERLKNAMGEEEAERKAP